MNDGTVIDENLGETLGEPCFFFTLSIRLDIQKT
jgi:hypothetical protein